MNVFQEMQRTLENTRKSLCVADAHTADITSLQAACLGAVLPCQETHSVHDSGMLRQHVHQTGLAQMSALKMPLDTLSGIQPSTDRCFSGLHALLYCTS